MHEFTAEVVSCAVISLNKKINRTVKHSADTFPRAWLYDYSRGNKCQLMATSLRREVTEPAVVVPEVAKQHDVFVRAIAFGVLVSARASFCSDEIIRKFMK